MLTAVTICAFLSNVQTQDNAPPRASSEASVESVIVTGVQDPPNSQIDRHSYAVQNDSQAQAGSIADALRNIPSVQVDLQGHVSLRGNTAVTVLVDGKPSAQFSGDSLSQSIQTLPASQIERVEVMTNPSAAFRSDGAAGIINLVMRKAKGAGPSASARAQVTTAGAGMLAADFGYNSSRLSITGDASYRREQQMLTTLNEATSAGLRTADLLGAYLAQDTLNGHLGSEYDLSDRTKLSTAVRLAYFHGEQPSVDRFRQTSSDVLLSAFTRRSLQQGWQLNAEVTADLRHAWADKSDLSLTAIYSTMLYQRRRLDQLAPISPVGLIQISTFERHTHNARSVFKADYRTATPAGGELKLGYDFEYSSTVFQHGAVSDGLTDASQSGEFRDDEVRHEGYVTLQRSFRKVEAQAGLRVDSLQLALEERAHDLETGRTFTGLYPSLHLNYDLPEGRKLTASYSRRVNRPSYALLDPIPYPQNPGFVLKGNIDLQPEVTDTIELGMEKEREARRVSWTVFYNRTKGAFTSTYANQPDGTLLQQITNAGVSTRSGIEFVLADKLNSRLSYSLSADIYRAELTAPELGFRTSRNATTAFGRANLNWQMTSKDVLQLNVFVNGKTLLPQGYVAPFASGNIGYRHALSANASWMFVIQDPFQSVRTKQVLTEGDSSSRRLDTPDSRMASLTLVWNFTPKAARADFDFRSGGYGGTAVP